jgi:hypothetical protein
MAKKRLVKASISSVMAEKSKAGVESSSSILKDKRKKELDRIEKK